MVKRLTKREQQIFIVCAATGVIFVVYAGIGKPFQEKVSSLDDETQASVSRYQKSLRTVHKAKDVNEKYNYYLSHFKQDKSNDQVMSSVVSEIRQVAEELQLHISDLKPNRVKTEEFFNRFAVSLTIDSDFPGITKFLFNLQKEPHLFEVDELYFDKGARTNVNAIKARLVLSKVLIP